MIKNEVIEAIKTHVNTSSKREVCGLVVTHRRKQFYVPCTNVAPMDNDFEIAPEEFAEISDKYKVLAVVHSHIGINPVPSQADLIQLERNNLPYFIMNYPLNTHTYTEPTGYVAPYVGRPFVHGITDCYSIWRDFYSREFGIQMIDYPRNHEWWAKGDNLYLDNYQEAGFVEVDSLEYGDIILMRVASQVPNHCAVYMGNNIILHHVMGKVSSNDVYGGWWKKITAMILRHKSKC